MGEDMQIDEGEQQICLHLLLPPNGSTAILHEAFWFSNKVEDS